MVEQVPSISEVLHPSQKQKKTNIDSLKIYTEVRVQNLDQESRVLNWALSSIYANTAKVSKKENQYRTNSKLESYNWGYPRIREINEHCRVRAGAKLRNVS